MRRTSKLPDKYDTLLTIDLQKNKKQRILVNGLAAVIAMILLFKGIHQSPSCVIFDRWWLWLVTAIAMVVYSALHECVHGAAMKMAGTPSVQYGYTGLYAFAGSKDYYAKKPYIIIALAPVVVFGIIFDILTLVAPDQWFWVVQILQTTNIAGATGDLYVTYTMLSLPNDILIRDTGTAMRVYART